MHDGWGSHNYRLLQTSRKKICIWLVCLLASSWRFSVVMRIIYVFHVSGLIDHLLYILCVGEGGGVFHILGQIDQNVSIARDGRLLCGPHSGLTGAARGVGRELWPGTFTICLLHCAKHENILYMYQAQCTMCRDMFIICLFHQNREIYGAQAGKYEAPYTNSIELKGCRKILPVGRMGRPPYPNYNTSTF